jgi:hypothetical protein
MACLLIGLQTACFKIKKYVYTAEKNPSPIETSDFHLWVQ